MVAMSAQEQFLDVIDRDEAELRFHAAIRWDSRSDEVVPIDSAMGRVLACDVAAEIDVPSFDRSNVDGFAVQAADTFGAREEEPRRLMLLDEAVVTAAVPRTQVMPGTAMSIATGGMLPRGADAVVMVEHADLEGTAVLVRRAVTPGAHVSFAGTDITAGETVVRRGERLTSRETGVLAAVGISRVSVWTQPRVAVISTGDELISPGEPMHPGLIYDSNARIIADAVREAGGIPVELGIVPDDMEPLRTAVRQAIAQCDVVLLSGGTSKGAGDLSYRVVRELTDPGIVAHGVALKPGKPICLAVTRGKPVVILPGFPTSAIFTFHEFVAPVIRRLAGLGAEQRNTVRARMAVKVNSEIGRTEYVLVGLVHTPSANPPDGPAVDYAAFPLGKGSGSVTTFSRADGFVTIGRHEEMVLANTIVDVQLLGRDLRIADLVIIGSHCVGLDFLLSRLRDTGWHEKFLAVGSTAGLDAARRGECDLAGIHLLDPVTGEYNLPFVTPGLELVRGYRRLQGVVFRPGDSRFEGKAAVEAIRAAVADTACLMVNRNQGSGTRILIDQLLDGAKPGGYPIQSRSHNAVAAAVKQGRADWGVAIETVARQAELGFLPLREERFDFVMPRARMARPAVQAFVLFLRDGRIREQLEQLGFRE